ncbi:hypothetical protein [Brazilian marseillevirus]|uniref:hypothetical protein n=1 Tax=Brazilian marseillevirus TaxID=1813599 RepID=UPI00078051EA|nr:hypothetical protein A3303_gp415 [Brazilian marseillevirus]AMQ10923.1 hypothetical protein [Brazilian marseillevirus]
MDDFIKLAKFYSENSQEFATMTKKERQKRYGKLSLFRYCREEDVLAFSRLPLELFVSGKSIAEKKNAMDEFSRVFGKGCIAKNVNSLSFWISKNSE